MRVILHCDANGFYASCELMERPALRGLPVSVGGDPEARHGIVLASSQEAKRFGIKTGMVLWQARQLCPQLITLPPNFKLYTRISRKLRQMYTEYSPLVESYGLDECWVDLTSRGVELEDGKRIADSLRKRAWNELGITLSIGVSWNKLFAKLGSDYKKPDATTLITPENYQEILWPLPVGDLLFVGPQTVPKLRRRGINTIGDIAALPRETLAAWFGKVGVMHHIHACGEDESPVMEVGFETSIKSIGNSTTTPQDMETVEDVRCVFTLLAESIARRLREAGLKGHCISIHVRDAKLKTAGCQRTIRYDTTLSNEIVKIAMALFESRGYVAMLPLRSVGVSVSSLVHESVPEQQDLFGFAGKRKKQQDLAVAVDSIRQRYGTQVIMRGNVLRNAAFSGINPHDDHTIHPVPFYTG